MKKEKTDILLVRPVNHSQQIVPQLSLGYLATSLRNENISVEILDCVKSGFNYTQFKEYVRECNPKVVGFQMFTVDMLSTKKSIKIVKDINSSILAVVGGAQPSGAPEDTLKYLDKADYGFCGESEISLVKFMEAAFASKLDEQTAPDIPGLIWKNGKNIVINKPEFIDDLDSLGFPSWDMLKPNTYPEAVQGYFFEKFPVAGIIATRGCPYSCTFCSAKLINAQKIRKRSIPHVIEEIQLLYKEYGIREIHVLDDNFSFYRDYIEGFCEELIKTNLKISWRCANSIRLDTVSQELLKLMKRSGCYSVAFGIENGSDRILKKMKKKISLAEIEKSVKVTNDSGIDVNGSFIIGYPGETEEEIKQTLKFSRKLGLKLANFNCLVPLPGTEVYNDLVKAGKLNDLNWEDYSYSKVVYVPGGLTKEKLKSYQRKAILQFYLRPKILFYLVKNIKSVKHFCYILEAAFVYLFGKSGNSRNP